MGMEYIRQTYGVPAKRGGHVIYTDANGRAWPGVITSARSGRLLVRLDDNLPRSRARAKLHPTWNLTYLEAAPDVSDGPRRGGRRARGGDPTEGVGGGLLEAVFGAK
jgi:hypothetical protein